MMPLTPLPEEGETVDMGSHWACVRRVDEKHLGVYLVNRKTSALDHEFRCSDATLATNPQHVSILWEYALASVGLVEAKSAGAISMLRLDHLRRYVPGRDLMWQSKRWRILASAREREGRVHVQCERSEEGRVRLLVSTDDEVLEWDVI